MRNRIRACVLGITVVVCTAVGLPSMAAARQGEVPSGLLARLKHIIIHVLDVVDIKNSLPPG